MLLLERGRAEFQIQGFLMPMLTLTQDAMGVRGGQERERQGDRESGREKNEDENMNESKN